MVTGCVLGICMRMMPRAAHRACGWDTRSHCQKFYMCSINMITDDVNCVSVSMVTVHVV